MTRVTAIIVAFLAVVPSLATAQSLVEVARTEEARRKSIKKPAKTYSNVDLKPDVRTEPAPMPATQPAVGDAATPAATPTPGAAVVNIPLSPDPGAAATAAPGAKGDQAFWNGRITAARTALERSRLFADALQSRINALNADVVNRDDPAQRAVLEQDRVKALAELERVKKEMADQTKAIAAIQDEARVAGVPPGWVR